MDFTYIYCSAHANSKHSNVRIVGLLGFLKETSWLHVRSSIGNHNHYVLHLPSVTSPEIELFCAGHPYCSRRIGVFNKLSISDILDALNSL